MDSTLMLLLLFAFLAAFIQRTTGFGFGIVIMTILPYLLPSYGEATMLSGLMAMITSLWLTWLYRKSPSWSALWPILLTFLFVSGLAILVVTKLPQALLKHILGAMLIVAALWFSFIHKHVHLRPSKRTQVSLGTVSGVMGGFFGMQGPPAVLYFIEVAETKEAYIALAQTYFLVGNAAMTLVRMHEGFLTQTVLWHWVWAIPAVVAGTLVGDTVFKFISLNILRKIVFIYIGISGVIALLT